MSRQQKAPLQRGSSQTFSKSERTPTVGNVPCIDGAVKNYRQFILCTTGRSPQVRAWLEGVKIARQSLRPFLDGYELRVGVGEWFPEFATESGSVICWCELPAVAPGEPVLDISPAALGIRHVEQRDRAGK